MGTLSFCQVLPLCFLFWVLDLSLELQVSPTLTDPWHAGLSLLSVAPRKGRPVETWCGGEANTPRGFTVRETGLTLLGSCRSVPGGAGPTLVYAL